MQQICYLNNSNIKHVHFIGIGGISMSGLSEILMSMGYQVSGSDLKKSNITQKLAALGAKISISHTEENIQNPDLVVYTAAVKDNNSELMKARSLQIPAIERAVLLGEIMKKYPKSVAISGTHGKTTTTSMVSMIMLEANLDPTIHIGGELPFIGGNTKLGGREYFVTEACEYVESFLKFHPYLAVVLNVEEDHLDYFKDLDHIMGSFTKFIKLIPENGHLVVCGDDTNSLSLLNNLTDSSVSKITYAIDNEEAQWRAIDITFDTNGCGIYTLKHYSKSLGQVVLSVPGLHNISNSLGAIAACMTLGCSFEAVQVALKNFGGTKRRFELKGNKNNISVVDDYAHHPSEVKATLAATKRGNYKNVWCVFQPHTYTRTKALLSEFSEAFYDAHAVIITDIYAAREVDNGEIHASQLSSKLSENGINAVYLSDFPSILSLLLEVATPGDLILTMGAGDIYRVGEMFLES